MTQIKKYIYRMLIVTNHYSRPHQPPPPPPQKPFLRLLLEAFNIFCLLLDSLLYMTQLVLLLLENQCWAKK